MGLLEDVQQVRADEIGRARAKYKLLIRRSDSPKSGDADSLLELLSVIGLTEADVQADISAWQFFRQAEALALPLDSELAKLRADLKSAEEFRAEWLNGLMQRGMKSGQAVQVAQEALNNAEIAPQEKLRRLAEIQASAPRVFS